MANLPPAAMFTTLGLFGDVPCPQGEQCALLTCMFSHKSRSSRAADKRSSQNIVVPDDESLGSQPVAKKPKLETARSAVASEPSSTSRNGSTSGASSKAPRTVGAKQQQRATSDISKLQSATRKVSPPPPSRKEPRAQEDVSSRAAAAPYGQSLSRLPPRKAPKESLNPRMLTTKAPAAHGVRSAILKKLHSAMAALNDKLAEDKATTLKKCFVLNPDELITMALDEEEKTAKDCPNVYSNVIKLRIVKLTKMATEDWTKEVMAHLNTRYYHNKPIQLPQKETKPLDTGLSTREELALLTKLRTPMVGLEEFGYITKPPTASEINTARRGVIESKGWEKCDRCGARFQVFPGRREDGSLTSAGQCYYHSGRPVYPPRKQMSHITGSSEAYFPCCGESLGASSGCTKASTHVFKVAEAKRLASILPFETTPAQAETEPLPPVCVDCEMGYTTYGLELIRLTAVGWPEGRELLDVLVKPMGEVLDLNSRFSGVFPEHYATAQPYGTFTANAHDSADGKADATPKPLQVVESPAAARALLFSLLQPDTPLIGHAIDNDLNACRIIHPTIIDTVLLYPHPRGRLPNRMSLKTLARKFLDRDIQTGGERGHDSKEDAIATGDLVRVKASETWKELKRKGWRIEQDTLVPPAGQRGTAQAARELGHVAQKRSNAST